MTTFEAPSGFENQEIPKLQLNLKDVPESSPQAFNQALRENVAQAARGLTDYLNQNRKKAIDADQMLRYFGQEYRKELEGKIDKFIQNLQLYSDQMLSILNLNQDKPIEEQRALLKDACLAFYGELARKYGVMQSSPPYELGNTREIVEQGIVNPIMGYKGKLVYRPPVKREYYDPEQANADQILDELR